MSQKSAALTSLVDWVQLTLPTVDVDQAFALLGIGPDEFREMPRGLMGYPKQLACGEIKILHGASPNMGVHVVISGQGCRQYETFYASDAYLIESRNHWMSFFYRAYQMRASLSRFDLAIDEKRYGDEKPFWTVSKLVSRAKKGYCRTKFKGGHVIEKVKFGDGSSDGITLYFGSPQSDTQIRCYEKNKEREANDMELEKDLTVWNRLEMQLRDQRANAAVQKMLEGVPSGDIVFGVLNQYVHFCNPSPGDSNKARWPVSDWWLDYLSGVEKLRLAAKAPDATIESKQRWIDRQVLPTLSELYVAMGMPDVEYFVDQIEAGMERMTEAQWQRADEAWEETKSKANRLQEEKRQKYLEHQEMIEVARADAYARVYRARMEAAAAAEEQQKDRFAQRSQKDPEK